MEFLICFISLHFYLNILLIIKNGLNESANNKNCLYNKDLYNKISYIQRCVHDVVYFIWSIQKLCIAYYGHIQYIHFLL